MLGSDGKLIENCLRDNGQYGFNAYHADGVKDVVLNGNEIAGNNTDDWEKRQPGCGCTGGGKFWETHGAKITDNYVHDNKGVGLWADSNNVGFRFEGNYISDNDAEGIMYETSYNAVIVNNTFVRNALVKGPTNPGFPASAIYLSESGSDSRVKGRTTRHFELRAMCSPTTGRASWPGRTRIGSPARPPTPAPASARWSTHPSPPSPRVRRSPRSRSSRSSTTAGGRRRTSWWKATTFAIDPSKIPGCNPSTGCGFNGLFSNYGTYPRWSPYHGKGRAEGHHVQAEQRVAEQHLHRGLAFHGEGGRTRGHLGRVAISALRPGRRQQHELMA